MQFSSIRKSFRAFTIGLCVPAGIVLGASTVAGTAFADIGTKLEQSQARVSSHTAKHRGRYPLFKTNRRGVVVWECWEAPSGGWTKPQAMSFVKDLVPPALQTETPRRVEPQTGGEMLVYRDGTAVWLEHSSVRASFRLVAVMTREYDGPLC